MRAAGGAALGAAGGSDARRYRWHRRRLHAEESLRRGDVQIRLLIITHSHQYVHIRPVAAAGIALRSRRRRNQFLTAAGLRAQFRQRRNDRITGRYPRMFQNFIERRSVVRI